MRLFVVLFIILILITGCAWRKATPVEKGLYVCMVVTTATDMITTDKILDRGGMELNPILTAYPNNEALWMFAGSKILLHSIAGYYSEFWRKYGWGASCVGGTVLTIHNFHEIKDR